MVVEVVKGGMKEDELIKGVAYVYEEYVRGGKSQWGKGGWK